MKVLITGGAGFIGSAVVRLAVAQGHEVINLDALTYAACLDNVASVAGSNLYTFEQADIRDRAALDRIFALHAGAQEYCEQFLVGECLWAIGHQSFARPLIFGPIGNCHLHCPPFAKLEISGMADNFRQIAFRRVAYNSGSRNKITISCPINHSPL